LQQDPNATPEEKAQAESGLAAYEKTKGYKKAVDDATKSDIEYTRVKEDLANREERIQNSLRSGAISEMDALRQTQLAREEAVASMGKFLTEQEKALAGQSKDSPEVIRVKQLREQLKTLEADSHLFAAKFESIFTENFSRSFSSFVTGAATAKEAFASFGRGVVSTIGEIVAKELSSQILTSILKPLGSTALGGLGSLASLFFADGGVMSGPGISAHSGTIVNTPTVFPFAKGTGLMGEAGPEAILPLKRDSYGKLGVSVDTQGQKAASSPTIIVNVQSSGKETPEEMGNKVAEAAMRAIAAEEAGKALRQNNYRNTTTRFG
jgi:lambda family phage tail tape measure protein